MKLWFRQSLLSCLGTCLLTSLALVLPARAAAPKQAAVASAHYLASEAGHRILAEGGNAFDAAVAVAAALAVVEPESSGIGGGAFFLLHRASDKQSVFVDAREIAPGAASRDMYLDANGNPVRDLSVNGPLAAGIPGHPAGLAHVARKYGRLPLKQSLAPAIELARKGFAWDEKNATMMAFRKDVIASYPGSKRQFLPGGKEPKVGQLIKQPDLAKVLVALAQQGEAGFYQGKIAKLLVDGVRAANGIWTLDDLAKYKVVERPALIANFRDQTIITAPPPSSGGIALISMLEMLEGFGPEAMDEITGTHVLTEVMRRAYRDRAIYLGDPDFVSVPVEMLTSPYYAAGLRASIRLDKATPSSALPGIEAAPAGTDTTHFSLIDREGNMVAATLTVNLPFGSGFVAPGTGFLLNNEMDDFSMKPGVPNAFGLVGEDANAIAPYKRPLSSMTPTIAIGPKRSVILGTPGGSRIISMVLLAYLQTLHDKDASTAVNHPRIHHQYLPDVLSAEPNALSAASIEALRKLGHEVKVESRTWGNMHAVIWSHQDGEVDAASDGRWRVGRAIVR